ncbi:pro-sigmaK processing inhibitor BofA family protein [Pseudogracilibacillus auburnensis]|uniref:Inhibitor of the pro-sigma K processing machinery n=1 Tax=Pseudogracilibacillus auburnensis TaxID=1494959 RepID=A0A2V3VNC8_9BACI|nr:pro-sigmaK processing inhibitor BofA family protein [Pseudogracilibacillus auburnensis]MBO1004480.1 pro-sigmaK processing inhibitor BofA family protein [Pseudogracilibacillus auburnensis]PXW81525.1 inhibitor of the pro-sigma K processing machinery [Pseudogracilibacillus auburnensis]
MNTTTMIIIGIIGLVIVLFIIRAPSKASKILGHGAIRLTIGVLLLFFLNVFGGSIGLHVPINIFTVLVSSVLGIFGVTSLAAIHLFIL